MSSVMDNDLLEPLDEKMLDMSVLGTLEYAEDAAIDELLTKWDLIHLKEFFMDENITVDALKLMENDELQNFLQKLKFGDKVLLRDNIEKWRSDNKIPLHSQKVENKTAEGVTDTSKIKLIDILKQHKLGCRIMEHFDKKKNITNDHRKILVNIIAEYFDSRALVMNLATSYRLEQEILVLFPTEKLEFYRTARRGKIYTKFHNKKKLLKSLVPVPTGTVKVSDIDHNKFDDQPIEKLLSIWKLSHLQELFKDKNITTKALQIMGADELQELLQDLTCGDRIILKGKLEEWRSEHNNAMSSASSQIYEPFSKFPNVDLTEILNQHKIGCRIRDLYKSKNELTEEQRKMLLGLIVDYFDAKSIEMDLHTSYRLEEDILSLFPTEKLEYYRTAKRGKLYLKYHNRKRSLKSLGVNPPESSAEVETNKEITSDFQPIIELLNKWNLSHLRDFFKAKNLTTQALKIIENDDLQELLKELTFGDKVILRTKLAEWRSETPQSEPSPPVVEPECSRNSKLKLIDILNQHKNGRRILYLYKSSKDLTEEHRKMLLSIIADYFDAKSIEMDLQTSYKLEEDILRLFPTEKLEYYRTAKRGKLYLKYHNKKRSLKSFEIHDLKEPSTSGRELNRDNTAVAGIARQGFHTCQLCRNNCEGNICLRQADGLLTEAYNITRKFFNPMFLDNKATGDKNSPAVLCKDCWRHISEFNDFKQRVLLVQANLLNEVEVGDRQSQEEIRNVESVHVFCSDVENEPLIIESDMKIENDQMESTDTGVVKSESTTYHISVLNSDLSAFPEYAIKTENNLDVSSLEVPDLEYLENNATFGRNSFNNYEQSEGSEDSIHMIDESVVPDTSPNQRRKRYAGKNTTQKTPRKRSKQLNKDTVSSFDSCTEDINNCPHCEEKFRFLSDLDWHIQDVHPQKDEKPLV